MENKQENSANLEAPSKQGTNPVIVGIGTFFNFLLALLRSLLKILSTLLKTFINFFGVLSFTAKLTFIGILLAVIVLTFFVGYKMGQNSREKEFEEDYGVEYDQVKDFLKGIKIDN